MKTIVSSYLRKVFLLGVSAKRSRIENKKIILVNQINSIIIATSLLSGIFLLFFKRTIGLGVLAFGLIYLLPFMLQKAGKVKLARNSMLFFASTSIALFSYFLGFEKGIIFYLFPILIAMGYTFPYKHIKELLFQFLYMLSFFVYLIYEHFYINSDFDPDLMFWANMLYSFIYSTLIILLYSYRSQKDLENYNKKLELRQKTQQIAQKAIKDKEILIAEIHHRVKNNLAVITSMINLQMSDNINPEAREVLQESLGRILSMSLVHEKLYNQNDLSNVNVRDYIFSLVEEIKYSYLKNKKNIDVSIEVDSFYININQAVPIGLVLNELISNAFKHAFKDIQDPELTIRCSEIGQKIILSVKDNGNGFDYKKISQKPTLGITIIESLSEQLEGTYEFASEPSQGTDFIISFRRKEQ